MSDPIADLLTRIRNANMRKHPTVKVPASKVKTRILEVMEKEGFIERFEVSQEEKFPNLVVYLKYDRNGDRVIRNIERVSTPGLRIYAKSKDLKPVLNGQGIAVITTSSGLLSDRECRAKNVGGEVVCRIW
jgi:small subunit ribosomal protein S8